MSSSGGSDAVDALFTTRASTEDATSDYRGTAVLDLLVDPSTLQVDDVGELQDPVDAITRQAIDYPTDSPLYIVSGLPVSSIGSRQAAEDCSPRRY